MSIPSCRVAIPKEYSVPHETYETVLGTLSVRAFLLARMLGLAMSNPRAYTGVERDRRERELASGAA